MSKIAILSFYSGVVERGVETFAYEIAKRLYKKHQLVVYQAGPPKIQKFKVREVKALASPPKTAKRFLGKFYLDWQSLKILFFTARVLPKLYKNGFDLIIPLNGGWQTFLIKIYCLITGAKILISGHAGIGSDDAWNLLFRPDVFVALTKPQLIWAQKLVPEVKTTYITNGVDLSRFNPKVKSSDVNLEQPIVICVSALVPYKRVDLTVRAVAKTKNLSLLVVGDGEDRGSIDRLGKRLLGKRYLRIVVPYQEIPGYYRSAKVFTLVSKTEAFGISYVEAIACNLPVVATNDSSRSEIIGSAGILTNPNDLDQYAKDLEIAVHTNYHNLPYTQALNFSWNKVAEKYDLLFQEILKSK